PRRRDDRDGASRLVSSDGSGAQLGILAPVEGPELPDVGPERVSQLPPFHLTLELLDGEANDTRLGPHAQPLGEPDDATFVVGRHSYGCHNESPNVIDYVNIRREQAAALTRASRAAWEDADRGPLGRASGADFPRSAPAGELQAVLVADEPRGAGFSLERQL